MLLELKNLTAKIEEKEILHDLNFKFEKGKTYAIMGPNGSGKSTLASVILGHPKITLSEKSKIIFNGKDITSLRPEERARKGIFLSFQTPPSLSGVNVFQLFSFAFPKINPSVMRERIKNVAEKIGISQELLERSFAPGLSGGEKKKIEALQAVVFNPKLIILDEIDTGLDVDALRKIAYVLNENKKGKTTILITHYARVLKYIEPDYVLVLKEGRITSFGDKTLAEKIEREGYQKF
jgi:Fe-S cluster assembly ATP-binding protein